VRIFTPRKLLTISSRANVYPRDETENLRLARQDVSEPSTRIV
jgi:hypothetical protein